MTSAFKTILVIGGTGGLGEAFARRFHAIGKKVIVTGRRQDRLAALQKELPGLETRQMDVEDLASLPKHKEELLKAYPKIDTVLIMAGIQRFFTFADDSTSTDEGIISEVNINLTAPLILTRLFTPHLLSLKPQPGNLLLVSSGLAYIPFGVYPVYCPTKAAVHTLAVLLHQQLAGTNVNVIEIAPPYVATDLDTQHREPVKAVLGAAAPSPMPLDEYMDVTMAALDNGKPEDLREVGTGFSQMGIDTWRGSFGKAMEGMGVPV